MTSVRVGAAGPSDSGWADPTPCDHAGMQLVFKVTLGFWCVLTALCLVKTASVMPDRPMVTRWLCVAMACAFIAVFWEATRRRHVTRGSLRADPALAVLGGSVLAVLVLTMIVFAVTE